MKTLWCCHGCHVPNPCFLIFDALTKSLQNHPDLDSNSQQSYALVSSIWPQARHRCCRNVAFTYFCQLNLSDSRMCCAHWLLRKFQELVHNFVGNANLLIFFCSRETRQYRRALFGLTTVASCYFSKTNPLPCYRFALPTLQTAASDLCHSRGGAGVLSHIFHGSTWFHHVKPGVDSQGPWMTPHKRCFATAHVILYPTYLMISMEYSQLYVGKKWF